MNECLYLFFNKIPLFSHGIFAVLSPLHTTHETVKNATIFHSHYNFFSQLQRFFHSFLHEQQFSNWLFQKNLCVVCKGRKTSTILCAESVKELTECWIQNTIFSSGLFSKPIFRVFCAQFYYICITSKTQNSSLSTKGILFSEEFDESIWDMEVFCAQGVWFV